MKKIITLVCILLSAITFSLVGCTTRGPVNGFNPGGSGNTSYGQYGTPFKVQLRTADNSPMPSLDGISVIWTAKEGVEEYQAKLNSKGEASVYGPDGEYKVTLSGLPDGYTYDPNAYVADSARKRNLNVDLYPIREPAGGDGGLPDQQYKINSTGAYRFVFENAADHYYFSFGAAFSGKMSFESLLDITENKVSPLFYDANTTFFYKEEVHKLITGGGESNTYTKNFYYEYDLSNSQSKLFKIGVEVLEEEVFPVTIDVLIQKAGEFSQPGIALEEVPAPKNLPQSPEGEGGTFVLLANDFKKVLDDNQVELRDGYYYVKKNGKRLYALLTRDINNILMTQSLTGLSDPMVSKACYAVGKDYTKFFNAYKAKVNSQDGYHVDEALKQFLYDFSLSKQYFFDGYGSAEGGGYVSNDSSRWLFACGYYK